MGDLLIKDKTSAKSELIARLEFETLLADLSARFVNVPADQVDGDIVDAQLQLCARLGMAASSVWQLAIDEPGTTRLTQL